MKLSINGQDREFPELDENPALMRLVNLLQMKPDRIAIERNGDIVSRAIWGDVLLAGGDKLEIVQFVGGGRQSSAPVAPSESGDNLLAER